MNKGVWIGLAMLGLGGTAGTAFADCSSSGGTSTIPSMNPQDQTSPRYCKVALNGRPLPDEKPQAKDESDREKEQTYVQMEGLSLHHSVSDIYIPLAGSDLALKVQRNYAPMLWDVANSLLPSQRVDLPFGPCWSSNLAARAETCNDLNTGFVVTLVDDEGSTFRFWTWMGGVYVPYPTSRLEQDNYLATLVNDSGGKLILTKKFGTKLTYSTSVASRSLMIPRPFGTNPVGYSYRRLESIQDRFGNQIIHQYDSGNATLIPNQIYFAAHPDQKIVITTSGGYVSSVTDPAGQTINYGYEAASWPGVLTDVSVLASVSTVEAEYGHYADSGGGKELQKTSLAPVTTYGYTPMIEPSYMSIVDGDMDEYDSLNLSTITSPGGLTTSVSYALDTSKTVSAGFVIVPQNGNPPYVTQVSLSSGGTVIATSHYENDTHLAGGLGITGVKKNIVTDAEGNKRIYEWGGVQGIPIVTLGIASGIPPYMIVFSDMTITYQDASGTTLGSEQYAFDLASNLSVSSVTDFSGNTKTYAYGDDWDISVLGGGLSSSSSPFRAYSDPTSQTDALGHTKTFAYQNPYRIMKKAVDEEGRATENAVDSLGRRTSESVQDAGGTEIRHTDFQYGNATFPHFLTAKIVRRLGAETQSWAHDQETDYVADAYGRVWKEIVDPSGLNLVTETRYDLDNNKTSVKDPRGNTTAFVYGPDNRLREIDYPAIGGTVAKKFYVYDVNGNKIEDKDEDGHATLREYDPLNRLVAETRDMDGNERVDAGPSGADLVTTYAYNAVNSKTSVTDPDGHATAMDYDALQRLVTVTDPQGKTKTFAYGTNSGGSDFDSSSFKPTTVVDEEGYATTLAYDALYRLVSKQSVYDKAGGAASTTGYAYDNVGNPVTVTDPLGHATATEYDALNRPVLVTYADGATRQTAYTTTGLPYRETDELGRATLSEYDNARRPVKVTAPQVDNGYGTAAHPVTHYGYDANGNRTRLVNPLGKEWDYAYDARNRKTQEQQPGVVNGIGTAPLLRPTLATAYDLAGNVTATLDPMGSLLGAVDPTLFRTEYTYDPANRKLTQTSPSVPLSPGGAGRPRTSYAYDKAGNVLTLTDPDGHATANTYDELNRLLTTTDGAGNTVTNGYDSVGNKTTVQDGNGHTTTFAYDGLKRNTALTDPLGHATAFTYNALLKTQRTDALGETAAYAYDPRDRLTSVTYGTHTLDNRAQTYDLAGNLLSVAEANQPTSRADVAYTYDALNRVLTEKSNGATHQYAYDLANNRVGVKYGGTNRTLISVYDGLNRLLALADNGLVTAYAYDLNGNVVSRSTAGGTPLATASTVATTYDLLNRRATLTGITGTTTAYTYGQLYDAAGNLVQEVEAYPVGLVGRTVTNTYDGANRLTNEASVGLSTTNTGYSYDAANNRTQKTVNGTATTYAYNSANQLTGQTVGAVTTSYTYDANGNRLTRGGDAYVYDGENRLTQLTQGGIVYKYVYDYRTRRVIRTENDVTTQVVFSGGTSVQEYDNFGTLQSEFLRGSDWGGGVGGILYSLHGGVPFIDHYNGRGDVVAQSSLAGLLTYQAQYEAFGKRVAEVGASADRQRANTKEEDPTGLLNEGFRYRDLDSGTFITKDPAGPVRDMGEDYWLIDGRKVPHQPMTPEQAHLQAASLNQQTANASRGTSTGSTAKDTQADQDNQFDRIQDQADKGGVPKSQMHLVQVGEVNWYAYVVQNPWSKFDPEGLSTVRITDTNNKKTTMVDPSNRQVRDALSQMKDGSIKKMEIVGHGNRQEMHIGPGKSGDELFSNPNVTGINGKVQYDDTGASFADSVRSKLAPGASIELNGCNTAREGIFGNDHITKNLSLELPGIKVIGSRGFGIGNEMGNPFNRDNYFRIGAENHVAEFSRTYENGVQK